MAKMILFDQKTGELSWVECNSLEDYYSQIHCEYVEHTEVKLNGQVIDILVDENGLANQDNKITAIFNLQPWLVGNILFMRSDEELGDFTDAKEEDMEGLKKRLVTVVNFDTMEEFKVLSFGR